MMSYLKSNTIQSVAFLAFTQMPELSNPIWAVLADTGLPSEYVAGIKIAAFVLGFIGVIWGRKKAKGPL